MSWLKFLLRRGSAMKSVAEEDRADLHRRSPVPAFWRRLRLVIAMFLGTAFYPTNSSSSFIMGWRFTPLPVWGLESSDVDVCETGSDSDDIATCTRVLNSGALSPEQKASTYDDRGVIYLELGQLEQAIVD